MTYDLWGIQIALEFWNSWKHSTLFPTAYPFPQLKTHLGVIESNFFIHTNKTSQNKKKIQIFFKNCRKIEFLKKFAKKNFSAKCAPFSQISIFWALVFCKHPYFDSTNWFKNKNIVLYGVMWGQLGKEFKGPEEFQILFSPKIR